jgi:hypothetical protein
MSAQHINLQILFCGYGYLVIIYYSHFFPPVALQSLKDLGRLTHRRFLELFRHMVGLLGRVISPPQSLYLQRTTQHRKTRTNIHTLGGIQTHDPNNQQTKTHTSDRTATVIGCQNNQCVWFPKQQIVHMGNREQGRSDITFNVLWTKAISSKLKCIFTRWDRKNFEPSLTSHC